MRLRIGFGSGEGEAPSEPRPVAPSWLLLCHTPRLGRPPSFRRRGTMAPLLARRSKGQQGRSREPRPTRSRSNV